MKKLHEYIEHADECRRMARVALSQVAATSEQLAGARSRQLTKQSRKKDEADEGKTPASAAVWFR